MKINNFVGHGLSQLIKPTKLVKLTTGGGYNRHSGWRQSSARYLALGIASGLLAINGLVIANLTAPVERTRAADSSSDTAQGQAWLAVDSDITPVSLDLANADASTHLVTGSQTVKVKTNSVRGYTVVAAAGGDTTTLAHSRSDVSASIVMTNNSTASSLADNTWGLNTSGSTTNFTTLSSTVDGGATITASSPTTTAANSASDTNDAASHTYTYGVRVDSPSDMPAGIYSTLVAYTVTAQLPTEVEVNSISPDSYRFGATISQSDTMTITGNNLDSAYRVYLTASGLSTDEQAQTRNQYDCTISSATSTTILCALPNVSAGSASWPELAGDMGKAYDVHVLSQASDDTAHITKTKQFSYYRMREISGTASHRTPSSSDKTQFGAADSTDSFTVTLDPHMIPIKYTGDSYKTGTDTQGATETPQWSVVQSANLASDWFDYNNTFDSSNKISGKTAKWANAVTVKADRLQYYLDAEAGTDDNKCGSSGDKSCLIVDEDDVLGYWVYIPRYAYRVRRYQASDKFVAEQNFDIHFETADTPKSIPAASCNKSPTEAMAADIWSDGTANNTASNIKVSYYEDSCSGDNAINTTYHGTTLANNEYDGTSWATHPAFSFGGKELNGFWMAKYEMTGSRNQSTGTKTGPTIKPGLVSNVSETVGQYMAMARSMGVEDKNNNGDYSNGYSNLTKDSHSLSMYSGNLTTGKQWGAAAYLSASQYGAGVNNVQNNGYDNWYKTSTNGSTTTYNIQTDDDNQNVAYCATDSSSYGQTCFQDANGNGVNAGGTSVTAKTSVIGGQMTGCGPYASGSNNAYSKDGLGGIYGSDDNMKSAECAAGNEHSYQGALGVLASTTNNVYGIYDMAGGNWDYVAANLTNRSGKTASTSYKTQTGYQFMGAVISSEMTAPYVDLFNGDDGAGNTTNNHSYDIDTEWSKNDGKPPFTLQSSDNWTYANAAGTASSSLYATITNWTVADWSNYYVNQYNNDYCTWSDCGGMALHETKNRQSVNAGNSSWGGDGSNFPYAQNSWLIRGGRVGDTSIAGVFASYYYSGWGDDNRSARASATVY